MKTNNYTKTIINSLACFGALTFLIAAILRISLAGQWISGQNWLDLGNINKLYENLVNSSDLTILTWTKKAIQMSYIESSFKILELISLSIFVVIIIVNIWSFGIKKSKDSSSIMSITYIIFFLIIFTLVIPYLTFFGFSIQKPMEVLIFGLWELILTISLIAIIILTFKNNFAKLPNFKFLSTKQTEEDKNN
ncbi:hypothetical protein [Mycoplasmopsis gallopavonis]|uniref:Transmembrane protein n=1 Tax=Mycoplasmopsis gallopavonis TaxID=76629 RepID=A0A449B054_9BACT|nr:hypothetical protein [Mycoplasmopsis gallopavonis]RIV16321.1 hypothetical protein D1113_02835 [Mycoplasmopsis gallopavonis]VEU73105.1 Uncharacterised protein [Mycoplasmopsis gallopavonis]